MHLLPRCPGFLLGACALLLPSVASGTPLDVLDPTPRAVQVEFERSVDLATVGVVYGAPLVGSWSVSGSTGTLVVSGSELESLRTNPFPTVPGGSDDYVLEIDLLTLEARVLPFVRVFRHSTGVNFSEDTRELRTDAVGGFVFSQVFCTTPQTPVGPCEFVPGQPYDPATGRLNGIGAFDVPFDPEGGGPVPPLFSALGDLRLSEVPEPGAGLLAWMLTGAFGARRAWQRGSRSSGRAAAWGPTAD